MENKLKKDPSRSDDLLSSYSCSFEKCSFEKNEFKNALEGCNSETIWDFHLILYHKSNLVYTVVFP